MNIVYVEDGEKSFWQASGEGPLRPIVAEGETKTAAAFEYNRLYGIQYEIQERLTHFALEERQ